jgi:2-aminomuconate deaminase
MKHNNIIQSDLPEPLSSFHPHAKVVGNLVFVSGLISQSSSGGPFVGVTLNEQREVLSYDIKAQTRQIFKNLELILKECDLTLEHVVDVSVFLTDIASDFKHFNEVYGEYFSEILPARTTVQVSRFPSPIQIELKVIASKLV